MLHNDEKANRDIPLKPVSQSNWRRLVVFSLTIPALGFMGYMTAQYWGDAWTWVAEANPLLVLVSLTALLASFYGSAMLFAASVQAGLPAGYVHGRKLLATFLISQIGKYVPGRVWSVVLQKTLMGAALPVRSAVLTSLELAGLSLVLAGGSAIAFTVWLLFGLAWAGIAFLAVGIALFLVLSLKLPIRVGLLLQRFMPGASHLSAMDAVQRRESNTPGVTGLVLYGMGYCAGWLGLMLAGAPSLDAGLRLTAVLSLSYIIGVVSLLPAGIGSREVALLVLGNWYGLDSVALASVAIVTRLAILIVELAAALLGVALLAIPAQRRGYP